VRTAVLAAVLFALFLTPESWLLNPAFAQQPQAQQGQPLSALNAKYVNGVAPGYWPTNGTGLTLNLSAGSSVCLNSQVSYAGGTLTMAASATNYVFLDMTKNCTPAFTSGGSGFPATGIPIAVVATSGSAITGISDARTWFAARPVVDPGGQVCNVKAFGAAGNGSTDDTTAIQAAINAAGSGGNILLPVGNYVVSSQIQVTANYQTIYGYGATIECNLASANDCFMIGSTSNALLTRGVSVYGLHLAPGPNTSANSGFRDNAQSTHFFDIGGTSVSGSTFYHFLENDNDQAQTVDHLYNMAGVITCNATSCGSALWSPGPSPNYAGITWLQNSDLTMGCAGNSIDWQSGNHLTVSRSILQAFSQWAARVVSSPVDFDGWTHWERGNCTNPSNDGNSHALGAAGLLLIGSGATAEGSPPGGSGTTVYTTNSAGSTEYAYYIVAWKSTNHSWPLLAGYLTNGPATIGSSSYVNVVWPALPTATSYDLLRVGGATPWYSPPYATGNYAIATGLLPANVCGSNGVCAYQDTVASPTSYTTTQATANYAPGGNFWPGDLVLLPPSDATNGFAASIYAGPALQSPDIVDAFAWMTYWTHIAFTPTSEQNFSTNTLPPTTGSTFSPGTNNGANGYFPPALLLPNYAAYMPPNSQRKAVLNLGILSSDQGGATDLVTLRDSNYAKTISTANFRPAWDATDTALCTDTQFASNLCLRAPGSLSAYLGKLADASNWSEQLTTSGKSFAVPVFGIKTANTGAPNAPTLADCTSGTTWQVSYAYPRFACIYDGANFELATWNGTSGASPPTWPTTPGNTVSDGISPGAITWECLGAGTALAANTTYYVKVATTTLTGKSLASNESSITTANDSNHHILIASGTGVGGATGYQVGCATTSGSEALLSAPFSGAYTGNAYELPIMSCSGSGSFNSSDTTGYGTFPGLFVGGGTAITAMNLYSTASITPTAVSATSCSDQTFSVTGLTTADRVSGITPPSALGNVSVDGYASAAGTVLLHFCNPSSASVTPPAGVYSFLAVH
jgi:hypothetical protein